MATENKMYFFQKGFNSIYNKIENCKFIPAPFDKDINTGFMYVQKREGTQEYRDLLEDIKNMMFYIDTNVLDKYALTTSKVIKYTVSSQSTVMNVPSDTIYTVIKGHVGGELKSEGRAESATVNSLTDLDKAWTVNEFAGMWVYLDDGKGVGDLQLIESNTSNTITVSGWSGVTPDSTTNYRIYPYLAESSFAISTISGGYTKYFDGTSFIKMNVPLFTVSFEYDGRWWYVDAKKPSIVYYSEVGQSFIIEGFIDTGFGQILDLKTFGDYLLICRYDKIIAINKQVDSSTGTIFYDRNIIVNDIGILRKGAIEVFSGSCYFIASDTNLYSLDITANTSNRIYGSITNQGKTVRGYLDDISKNTNIVMYQYKNNLQILLSDPNKTVELIYDADNEGWLANTFGFNITDVKVIDNTLYRTVGQKICIANGLDDLGSKFEQSVSMMFGLDNQFQLHNIRFLKLMIGVLQDTHITVKLDPYINFSEIQTTARSLNLESKINSVIAGNNGGMGIVNLGRPILGGDGLEEYKFTEVGCVKYVIGNSPWGFLHKVTISDTATSSVGFVLGGLMFTYDTERAEEHSIGVVI